MLPEIQLVGRELGVQVLLEVLETQGVAFFMHPIVLPELLEAVVGEVDVVVRGLRVVLAAGGAQVAVSVVEQLVLGSAYRPDPDVEFAPLEEQGPLHVLLHEPH